MMEDLFIIRTMFKVFGDKDKKYNPNDPSAVKKIKTYIENKLKLGYILYGARAGSTNYVKIANSRDIDRVDLNRFLLAPTKKLLVATLGGGQEGKLKFIPLRYNKSTDTFTTPDGKIVKIRVVA